MTLQPRQKYLLELFENLGTPLLTAVAEATERDRLIAVQQGQKPHDPDASEEAERIAGLLKSTAELGLALSRQIDLRMVDDAAADGVRLSLATLAAPLIANVYRVSGRTPSTLDIERMTGAMQAVTLFADNYNAAADATARMQALDDPFAPADLPQVHLMTLHALMPAINAISTFSFGQPEKNLLQDVMDRLTTTARGLRATLFVGATERDGLRAEIKLLSSAANLYAQAHFTEMSKLMFLDEAERDRIDLGARLNDLWVVVDKRLSMLRVMAETLVTGATAVSSGAATAPVAPAIVQQQSAPSHIAPVQQSAPAATTAPVTGGSPFSGFAKPADAAPVDKSNPMAFFSKPKDAAGGNA